MFKGLRLKGRILVRTTNKYHPKQQAAKNAAPVPTNNLPLSAIIPWAIVQYAPAARQNPSVAERKMPTKTAFVRREHIIQTKERRPMKTT